MQQAASASVGRAVEGPDCWAAAREGDPGAREYLVRRAASVAGAMLQSRKDLAHVHEDLAQEAGLSMLGYLGRNAQPPRELTHFLRWRVRGVISAYRKRNRRPAPQPLVQEPPDRTRDGPSNRLTARDLGRVLSECRAVLKPRHQQLLALRYDEQLSISEIADRTGARENTVSVWLTRAARALAQTLRKRGVSQADLG